jgi:hypothetical protein
MNKAIKRAWIKALRSGKYKQGSNRLQTPDGRFCCLGVLCEVYKEQTGRGKWISDTTGQPVFKYRKNVAASVLPLHVMKWAELTDTDPILSDDGQSAADLNDSGRFGFKRIATRIEKHL